MRIVVDDVERVGDIWHVALSIEDGDVTSRMLYAFPVDTMEWRAAEYGIDPADTATLLDIVMTEPHLNAEERDTGHQLHGAPDIPTARADHVARCARAKLRLRMSTRGKGSPLQRVRDGSPMDHEVLDVKRGHVEQVRTHLRAVRAPVATLSGSERAARLRMQLSAPVAEHDVKEDL
jgi:hypothetical protein